MIFGVDFGLKRIGIAKVINGIIVPLSPIMRKNRNQASLELKKILMQYTNDMGIITLVFGIPLSYNDSESNRKEVEMKKRITHFLSLIDFCGNVIYLDESYSSIEAEDRLKDRNYKKRLDSRKNGIIDSLSACIILERYLKENN